MGLDMYLYKLSKPTKSVEYLSQMSRDELIKNGYAVFDISKTLPPNFERIRSLAKKIITFDTYIDIDKIQHDFNIPDYADIIDRYWSNDNIIYVFDCIHNNETIIIPRESYQAKYIVTQTMKAFCIKRTELAYWRKNYDLSEEFHQSCDTAIKNCGYYPLNEAMKHRLMELDPFAYEAIQNQKSHDHAIVYHETY